MALQDNDQYRLALDLVRIGLQSGSIKLYGTGSNSAMATQNGTADAAYLIALLDGLSTALPR